MMKKLIVSDTIRASRDIYEEHRTGIEQYDMRSHQVFQKRIIYPSQISDWNSTGDAYPSRARNIPIDDVTDE